MANHRKSPYVFPARASSVMIEYLLNRRGYADQHTRYPFSWNVKVLGGVDWRRPKGECAPDATLDVAWAASDLYKSIDDAAIEQARQTIDANEWTSWPGDGFGVQLYLE